MHSRHCQLQLEDGGCFVGQCPAWQRGSVSGELVFTTGMVGYPESLTDPSFAGQILLFTYPLIGNYGVPPMSQLESQKIHAAGVVVSEVCDRWSHRTGERALRDWLADQGVWLMTDVDTRSVALQLRRQGTAPCVIVPEGEVAVPFTPYHKIPWVEKVSVDEPEVLRHGAKKVILVDCGMKQSIARELEKFDITLVRVPHNYNYLEEEWDALFLSNGPGDPEHCEQTVTILQQAMQRRKPIFGICLGAQLMARAAGAKTYRMTFGHRGQNQPCQELQTGKCYLTSQNHGYAIDESSLPAQWSVSYRNLNDGTVEGISHDELPFEALQFHPEAAPGPVDTVSFFNRFYATL